MSADPAPQERSLDPVALAGGLATVLVAAYILGGESWLPAIDLRWILAGIAGLLGIGLLASSLRR
ncbi:hypothetical protein [Thermocrispum municipale]|uniref:hypothetical protein n=1 Tax=Thermocrispum municipale TaxID=37926 RepID=UPI0004098397|nr:hypothetical protein [Thermocrispum municipale]